MNIIKRILKRIFDSIVSDTKLFTIDGIPVHLTGSFKVFFIGIVSYLGGGNYVTSIAIAFLVILLYFVILLHEFGHAFTLKWFGYKVDYIEMNVFGGAAVGNLPFEDHKAGFWCIINGPIVNLILATLAVPTAVTFGDPISIFFLQINMILFAFNCLPIYPMDGGRIFAYILCSLFKDKFKAINIACHCGAILGIAVLVFSVLIGEYFMSLIAFFIVGCAGAGRDAFKAFKANVEEYDRWKEIVESNEFEMFLRQVATEEANPYNEHALRDVKNLFIEWSSRPANMAKFCKNWPLIERNYLKVQ